MRLKYFLLYFLSAFSLRAAISGTWTHVDYFFGTFRDSIHYEISRVNGICYYDFSDFITIYGNGYFGAKVFETNSFGYVNGYAKFDSILIVIPSLCPIQIPNFVVPYGLRGSFALAGDKGAIAELSFYDASFHLDLPARSTTPLGPVKAPGSNDSWVADPVNVLTGEFHLLQTDLTTAGPLPITIGRLYSSRNGATNDLGYGWLSATTPFLVLSPDLTTINAADDQGGVYVYTRQGATNVWLPAVTENPEAINSIGSRISLFSSCITQTTVGSDVFYKWTQHDGSIRQYKVRQFPVGFDTRERPYIDQVFDNRGNAHTYTFGTVSTANDYGKIRNIRSSTGESVSFIYDINGRILTTTTSDARSVHYSYDDNGDLVSVTAPDGAITTYGYGTGTTSHLLTRESKPSGRVLENTYDYNSRVVTQKATVDFTRPGVLVTNATFDYYSVNGQTKVTDSYGRITTYSYVNWLITSIVDPLNQATIKTWYYTNDATTGAYANSLASVTDPRGLVTNYKYDSHGNVIETKLTGDLDGDPTTTETATTTATYNNLNQPLTVTDARGNTTTFTYGDATYPYLPTQLTTSQGGTILRTDLLTYTSRSTTDGNGVTNFAKGLLLSKTVAAGTSDESVTTYDYDASGFRVSETRTTGTSDPAVVLTYAPTARRELQSVTDAYGRTTSYTYDAQSRPLTKTVKDETGEILGTWTTTYNANGDVARTTGPRTVVPEWVEHDYDQAGRPSADRVARTQVRADGNAGVETPGLATAVATTRYSHDFFGNLTQTIDPLGNTTGFTYDAIGQMLTRSAYAGPAIGTALRTESFTYEPGGKPATSTNPLGGITKTFYTSTGQPRLMETPDGAVREWRYLPDGRLFREVLRNGTYWEISYDDITRTVTRTLKKADATVLAVESRTFDSRGNLISTTDAEGFVRTTSYDGLDRPKTVTGPVAGPGSAQQTITTTYDAVGQTVSSVNALGEETVATADALGRPISVDVKNALGALIRHTGYTYSADHQSVTVTTGTGEAAISRTSYTDPSGRPLLEIDGAGGITRQTYDVAGNRLSSTDELKRTTAWTFDALHQPITQTLDDGNVTSFTYDAAGNLLTRSMAAGLTSADTYDTAGRRITSRLFSGTDTSRYFAYTYYPETSPWVGLLQTATAPRTTVTTTYDDRLRPLTVTTDGAEAATDSFTSFGYDKRGLLTDVTQNSPADAAGPVTTLARSYDGYGQVLSEITTVAGVTHSRFAQTWDAARRRASLDEENAAPTAPLFSYTYQADGKLTQVAAATSATSYAVNFAYADTGLLTARTNPWRTQTVTARDAVGCIRSQATTVGGTEVMIETMAYFANGTLDTYGLSRVGDNAWDEARGYTYNSRGQVTSEGVTPAAQLPLDLNYQFDQGVSGGLGIRTAAKLGTGAPQNWQLTSTGINSLARVTLDQSSPANRTITATGVSLGADHVNLTVDGASVGTAQHPGWADPVGAWTKNLSLQPGNHTLKADAVSPSGQTTATATSTFTVGGTAQPAEAITTDYDADGNVVTRTYADGHVQTFTWDAFNRLIKLAQRDALGTGYNWTAVYDALGRRLKTTHQPVTASVPTGVATVTTSIFDPQVEFLEIGVAINGVKAWKVYGPDLNGRFGGLQGTGGFEATILDADGTSKGVINDQFGNGVGSVSGSTVSWFTTRSGGYGPLPGVTAEVLPDVSRLAEATAWRSRRIDPTGFYNLGARYYEPTSGRFLSPDPMGHAASMSLYDFCNGDPVNGFDPDGRDSLGAFAGMAGFSSYEAATNYAQVQQGMASAPPINYVPSSTVAVALAAPVSGGLGVSGELTVSQGLPLAVHGEETVYAGVFAPSGSLAVVESHGANGGPLGVINNTNINNNGMSEMNPSLGAYVGVSGFAWVSNVSTAQELADLPVAYTINVAGFGFEWGGLSISYADGQYAVSVSPPFAGVGNGISVSAQHTTSKVLYDISKAGVNSSDPHPYTSKDATGKYFKKWPFKK